MRGCADVEALEGLQPRLLKLTLECILAPLGAELDVIVAFQVRFLEL
jgi:hypothetical protein